MPIRVLKYSLLLFLALLLKNANSQSASFNHVTADDGLSYNSISAITQDPKGFIWIGTYAGLNKYDGYKMTQYAKADSGLNKLRAGIIRCLYADKENNLWIGTTDGGMSKLDLLTNQITTFLYDSTDAESGSKNSVYDIKEFEDGILYVAADNGLNIFDKRTNKFSKLKHNDKDPNTLLVDIVNTMTKDTRGHIWFGHSGHGLTEYIPEQKKFIRYTFADPKAKLRGNRIRNLFADSKGFVWISFWHAGVGIYDTKKNYFWDPVDTIPLYENLKRVGLISQFIEDRNADTWMCTAEKGIVRYQRKTGELDIFMNNPDDPESISDNTNLAIMEDKNGLIWSGTWKAGLNYFNPNCLKFGLYKYESNKENTLNDDYILSFLQDSKDQVVIGTGKSICNFNINTKQFTNVKLDPNDVNSLIFNSQVTFILKDFDDTYWYGSNGNGLYHYFPKTKKYKHYHTSNSPNSLSSDIINYILLDADNNLWISTYYGGINLFDRQKDNFTTYLADKSNTELFSGTVLNLRQDKKGKIWVGTEKNGLLILNPKTRTFIKPFTEKSGSPLYKGIIFSTYFDQKGKLWVSCVDRFLELDPETFKYIDHSEDKPLFRSDFSGITQDAQGNFWLISSNGLFRYNPSKKEAKRFGKPDGTQGFEFNYNAILKLSNDKILVGGWTGMNYFDPKEIVEITNPPSVSFTELYVLNKLDTLSTHISRTDQITLSYRDYFFAIHFAAFDFSNPTENKFMYKMDGLDEDWIDIGTQHQLTFTNLDPGDYVLNIKAANSQGVWNDKPLQLKITITPPFWRTKWFYALCLIVIIGSIYFYIKYREKKLRLEKEILEKKVEERTLELNEEKLKVEEAHKDIKDSIYYAQKIQSAIIPTEDDLKKVLPNSFVLFQPKDIVSGDFYWLVDKPEHVFCAIADCTGHGVPGGFMTMLGSGFLNEIVNEQKITEPAEILNKLREKIISTLKQTGRSGENKDGMDIVLLRFTKKNRELAYACANNGFILLDGETMSEHYGDKQPVGIYGHDVKPFTANKLTLKENVTLYSYTDGYPDQFGGEKGKKFKYKTLNELLIKNTHLQMSYQKDKLHDAFAAWKGPLEQIDDVCVMGIRF